MSRPPSATSIVAIPDSLDARLLVELTSHATDLSEASHTLRLALDAGEDSELWLPLTMHAATAYCRPFAESKVRARLETTEQFPQIPAELTPVHEMIRKYRNTTVAHSQSDLVLPIALARLDDHGAVRDVLGVTFTHPMPRAVAERFAELVDAVEALVEDATRPVTQRLKKKLTAVAPEVVAAWTMPEPLVAHDHEFSGARARTWRPQFTTYWHIESDIVHKDPSLGE
jgi:hypothetical protein